ncbi:MAG: hypothetical protein A2Y12_14125 [Planctomycetes bacterium GWF2_42_9]|nr:MAG: hypothetical protein A2Y12_14125 [Planctomycetes bacterium GWF2_42_9]
MSVENTFKISHCMKLSWRGWLVSGVMLAGIMFVVPQMWSFGISREIVQSLRIPYELSTDYWYYQCFVKKNCQEFPNVIVGDSFIWGEYVDSNNTLSACLNKVSGKKDFANLGVNGLHPMAAYGLIKYHGSDISGKKIILFFNPLWIQSPEIDLQGRDEIGLQHTKLIPQFDSQFKCYQAKTDERLSSIAERYCSWIGFANYINTVYLDGLGVKKWSMENPGIISKKMSYSLAQLTAGSNSIHTPAESWQQRGLEPSDYSWVNLTKSNHWKYWKKTINVLKKRNNKVFVLVGSFNPYLMTPESAGKYQLLISEIQNELDGMNVPYFFVPDLPSEYYTDASHVDGRGYKIIAEQMTKNDKFKNWY